MFYCLASQGYVHCACIHSRRLLLHNCDRLPWIALLVQEAKLTRANEQLMKDVKTMVRIALFVEQGFASA